MKRKRFRSIVARLVKRLVWGRQHLSFDARLMLGVLHLILSGVLHWISVKVVATSLIVCTFSTPASANNALTCVSLRCAQICCNLFTHVRSRGRSGVGSDRALGRPLMCPTISSRIEHNPGTLTKTRSLTIMSVYDGNREGKQQVCCQLPQLLAPPVIIIA